jgi:hypothetical protein
VNQSIDFKQLLTRNLPSTHIMKRTKAFLRNGRIKATDYAFTGEEPVWDSNVTDLELYLKGYMFRYIYPLNKTAKKLHKQIEGKLEWTQTKANYPKDKSLEPNHPKLKLIRFLQLLS